jgi:hypothetical protein
MKTIFGTLLLATTVAAPAAAQDNPFTWRKAVPAGQTVEIRNVMGDVRVTAASGSEVEIIARKSGGDPESVRVVVEEHAGGVTVCAIYSERGSCNNDRGHGDHTNRNDATVDFEVRIPRGVKLTAGSVSGDVEVTGLDARVKASTVSGSVRVSTSDIASASSVSGSIRVRMGRADWAGKLGFSTVSGDIDLEFAGDLNADVEMSTVSGELESDWPLSVSSSGRRAIRGRIGSGGRELDFSTVSGSVEIRKAQ